MESCPSDSPCYDYVHIHTIGPMHVQEIIYRDLHSGYGWLKVPVECIQVATAGHAWYTVALEPSHIRSYVDIVILHTLLYSHQNL